MRQKYNVYCRIWIEQIINKSQSRQTSKCMPIRDKNGLKIGKINTALHFKQGSWLKSECKIN